MYNFQVIYTLYIYINRGLYIGDYNSYYICIYLII